MKNINWKVRLKNPFFIVELILSIFVPLLSYVGLTAQDLTTWSILGDLLLQAISNPYVLMLIVVSVFNAVNDPLTSGLSDSQQALKYLKPRKDDK